MQPFKALELEDLQSTIDLCNLCFDEVTDYDYAKKVFLETRNDSNNIYINGIVEGKVIAQCVSPNASISSANISYSSGILFNTLSKSIYGPKVTVMAHGMGMPSASIYTFELIHYFGVKRIIRIGTCGAVSPKANIGDIRNSF